MMKHLNFGQDKMLELKNNLTALMNKGEIVTMGNQRYQLASL